MTAWDSNGRPFTHMVEHTLGLACDCLPTLEPDDTEPGAKPWVTHEWPKHTAVARAGIGHP